MPLHRLLVYHSCVVFDCCMRAPLWPVWLYSYITLLSLLSGNYRPVESVLTLKLLMCCQVEMEVCICPLQASSNVCVFVYMCVVRHSTLPRQTRAHLYLFPLWAQHSNTCTCVHTCWCYKKKLMFCLGWFLLCTLQICLMQYQRQCA